MKHSLLSAALSIYSLLAFAPSADAQDVPLVIGSSTGTSGTLCDTFQCTPSPVDVTAGTTALMLIKAGRDQFPLLMLSGPSTQCIPIPGITNSLIVRTDAFFTLVSPQWSRIITSGPGPQCGGWVGSMLLNAPVTLPAGSIYLTQVLAQVGAAGQLTLSNAVEITIR